jgi:hypothetical protein
MDYSNWMSLTTAIHDLPLRYICLPASHDSGTYALTSSVIADFSGDEVEFLEQVVAWLSAIQGIEQYVGDPEAFVYSTVLPAIEGLMTTNSRSISEQLADGIRCLDLRIYCDLTSSQFYLYHTLIGPLLSDVLDDIAAFLRSTQGEIVYVTMGHFDNFGQNEVYTQNVENFVNLVTEKFGNYAYLPEISDGVIANDPFYQTYDQIVSQGGTPSSKVILVCSEVNNSETLWPVDYSPVDNDTNVDNTTIYGCYSEADTDDAVISKQQAEFNERQVDSPFALFMILTPTDNDAMGILVNRLVYVFYGLAEALTTTNLDIAKKVSSLVECLKPLAVTPSWTSIAELCQPMDQDISSIIYTNFLANYSGNNPLSFIYVDFYETTNIVDLAINYSQNIFG